MSYFHSQHCHMQLIADYHSVVYIHTLHNTTRSLIDVVSQPHPGCVNYPQYGCAYTEKTKPLSRILLQQQNLIVFATTVYSTVAHTKALGAVV